MYELGTKPRLQVMVCGNCEYETGLLVRSIIVSLYLLTMVQLSAFNTTAVVIQNNEYIVIALRSSVFFFLTRLQIYVFLIYWFHSSGKQGKSCLTVCLFSFFLSFFLYLPVYHKIAIHMTSQ